MSLFNDKVAKLLAGHEALLMRKNEPVEEGNGVITRYRYPVLTAAHTPVFWRYDLNEETNPFLMERIGMNATLNAGAIKWDGKYLTANLFLLLPKARTVLIISASGSIR